MPLNTPYIPGNGLNHFVSALSPGGWGTTQLFGGTGSPVGIIKPTTTFAIYIQSDSSPPGLIWEWYDGQWH